MTRFTPGSWRILSDLTIRSLEWNHSQQMGDFRGCIIADLKPALGVDADFILGTRSGREHALIETLANAYLIAAAPLLYKKLKETLPKIVPNSINRISIEEIEQVLSKANPGLRNIDDIDIEIEEVKEKIDSANKELETLLKKRKKITKFFVEDIK